MNELLGWYGYDKVELRDSDNLEIGETPQHISVLKGVELYCACLGFFLPPPGNIHTPTATGWVLMKLSGQL